MRPMRAIASLFALGLMMALFHRVTAGAALEARATLALGFLLLAAFVGGDLTARARLPRITGYLLVGFAAGPWLGLVRRDEVDALRFIGDVALGLIVLAAGKVFASAGALNATVAGNALLGLAASLAVGALLGYGVSRSLGRLQRHAALFLVAVALVAAEVARLAQLETTFVALAAGLY